MKTRAKNLQLAGVELVVPTVLFIESGQTKGARTTLTVGYAADYVDSIVAPLVAEWLSRNFYGRFGEHGRGAQGDLAAEAFYDKLARHFRRETPFLAAIISGSSAVQPLHLGTRPHNGGQRRRNADMLSRFMSGAGLTRWIFAGRVQAFVNPKTGAAQVAFEPLPGGIEMTKTDRIDLASGKLCKRANEATAWYGFGVPMRDPADIVLMLRNEISAARHAHAPARRAAHG